MNSNYKEKIIYTITKRFNDRIEYENSILDYYHSVLYNRNILLDDDGNFFRENRNSYRREAPIFIGSIRDNELTLDNVRFIYDFNYMSSHDWSIKFKGYISKWIEDVRIKISRTGSVYLSFKLPQNDKVFFVRFSDHIGTNDSPDFDFATPLGTNTRGKDWDNLIDWFNYILNNNVIAVSQPYLYHATYLPLIESIKKNGLDSSMSEYKWIDSVKGVTYLSKSPIMAISYARASSVVPEHFLKDIVVLSVKTNTLDKSKLYSPTNVTSFDDDSTVEYRGIIKYENIENSHKY